MGSLPSDRYYLNLYRPRANASGLFASVALVRKATRFDFRTVPGTFALISVMVAGEFGGRKLGERAGLKVLLSELPADSQLREALVSARETGLFNPSEQGGAPSETTTFPTPVNVSKGRRVNKYGDPID